MRIQNEVVRKEESAKRNVVERDPNNLEVEKGAALVSKCLDAGCWVRARSKGCKVWAAGNPSYAVVPLEPSEDTFEVRSASRFDGLVKERFDGRSSKSAQAELEVID